MANCVKTTSVDLFIQPQLAKFVKFRPRNTEAATRWETNGRFGGRAGCSVAGPVDRRPLSATDVSCEVLPAEFVMAEGAARPRPAPPCKPNSLALNWSRRDDPPPPAPEPNPKPTSHSIPDDFGGFSPYTPPTPIQVERHVPRRPQSVVASRPVPAQLVRRPLSLGAEDDWPRAPLVVPVPRRPVPNTLSTLPRAGYGLPPSRSDYQLQRPAIMTNGYGAVPPSTSRRLSLPGGPVQCAPKPSATYHGLSSLAGPGGAVGPIGALWPMGAVGPMGVGVCGYGGSGGGLHPTSALSLALPLVGSPSTPAAVRDAVRHLLQQPRNGFPIMDHKLSLFIEILDAQEKFSKVAHRFIALYLIARLIFWW